MITKKDRNYINMCYAVARDIDQFSGARVCAAIVVKNKIIALGINQRKTHPLQAHYTDHKEKIFLHAEIDCIIRALKQINANDFRKATIYIARAKQKCGDTNKFIYGIAKPCMGCMTAIKNLNIKKIVYTTDDQNLDVINR